MSILIKGLALPNNCHMCFFGYGGFCDVAPAEEDGICPPHGRPSWCPLIELPPHDLIDKQKLLMHISDIQFTYADMGVYGNKEKYDQWQEAFDVIADAPTIIEAEVKDGKV